MIEGFESYTPEAWTDKDGLMLSGKPHNDTKSTTRRSGNWSVIVSRGVGGACLAISSLTFGMSSTAATSPTLTVDAQDIDVDKASPSQIAELSPIREINLSFNKLFDSVRAGQTLIPSERNRSLAQKALQSQKEAVDIDSWARKLADDIKDAND